MATRGGRAPVFYQAIAVLLVVACSSLAGCTYKSQPANRTQQCAASSNGKRCPDDYHCASDGFCWRNGNDPDGGVASDGKGGTGGPGGTAGGAAGGTGGSIDDGGVTPDSVVDVAASQDGPASCTTEQKRCNGVCVAINDPSYGCDSITCDPSACPAAGGATLVCQGTACVIGSCGPGTKKCGAKCVMLTDPSYGCGATTCDSSTCPAAGTGTLICEGTACVIGSCGPGTKKCGTKCVTLTDPSYGCGATSCDSSTCPVAGTGTLICQGTACVVGTCGAGTKKCGDRCVPTDANNGCADPVKCTPCAANETCQGAPVTSCQCVPNNVAACAGKACGPAVNNCGQAITCTNTCVVPQTCNGGSAGVNGCGCTADNAAACAGKACGPTTNNCGQAITCTNTCITPQTCNGGTAGVNGCGCTPVAMATACAGKCGSVPNGCGTDYTCGCPANQVCGATGACCTPLTKPQACANKACGTAPNGCGQNIQCDDTCSPLPNTTVMCAANNTCARGCVSGAVMLACSTASKPACGRWDFESNTTENWVPFGSPSLKFSSLHASSGFQSLALVMDPNFASTGGAQVMACPNAFSVAGKHLRAHLFFASLDGTPVTIANQLFVHLAIDDPTVLGAFLRVDTADPLTGPDLLLQGTIPNTFPSITTIQVLISEDGPAWEGTVYIDDVRFE